jgi:hypothetical protein
MQVHMDEFSTVDVTLLNCQMQIRVQIHLMK